MSSSQIEQRKKSVAGVFDRVAGTYGKVGPPFFAHYASRLVDLAQIAEGARVLDIGTGRGAVLFPRTALALISKESTDPEGDAMSDTGSPQTMTRERANHLIVLAREAKLAGPDAATWVERLTPEREDIMEAVRFLAENGEEDEAAEMAANVWRLWSLSGDIASGRELMSAALDIGEPRPSRSRALALYGDGLLAFRAGAMEESQARNDAALKAARAVNDREAEALALVGLSRVAFRDGDYARVRSLAAEARDLTRNLDASAGLPPLHLLAAGTRLAGDYDEAIRLYTESLEASRRLGNTRGVGVELHNIGHVELHRGNVQEAERCFAERAQICNHNDPYEVAMTHLNHAALAFARGDREERLPNPSGARSQRWRGRGSCSTQMTPSRCNGCTTGSGPVQMLCLEAAPRFDPGNNGFAARTGHFTEGRSPHREGLVPHQRERQFDITHGART